jgi:murein DD-endopeptidase MepM/ murein hydrolase activator NlpD
LLVLVVIMVGVATTTFLQARARLQEVATLNAEVEELRRQNAEIALLEAELRELRQLQEQMLQLAGIKPALGLDAGGPASLVRRLVWPADGKIVEPFELQEHPWVAIQARQRTVAASGDGVVKTVSESEAGFRVVLDHDAQLQTAYDRLELSLVAAGDSVDAGQVIALALTPEGETVPSLRFEILRAGEPLDPQVFIRGAPDAVDEDR